MEFSKIVIIGVLCAAIFNLGGLIAPAANAASLKCSPSKLELSLKTSTQQTRYIRTKSSDDLTEMHNNQIEGSSVGGLGGGEIGFKTASKFEITHQGDQACVNLIGIDVSFYAKPEIHIASNFNRASCEYNAVMGHEKGHIRIMLQFLREYSPNIKREIHRIAANMKTVEGPVNKQEVKNIQDKMQADFLARLTAYNNKLMPILAARQQKYDSPTEYARVAKQCKKWDEKLSTR